MNETWMFFGIIGAVIAAVVASGKNRNALGWAAAGFLFPLIGVIAVACCSPIKKEPEGAKQLGQL